MSARRRRSPRTQAERPARPPGASSNRSDHPRRRVVVFRLAALAGGLFAGALLLEATLWLTSGPRLMQRFLLDLGSGPVPRAEYYCFSENVAGNCQSAPRLPPERVGLYSLSVPPRRLSPVQLSETSWVQAYPRYPGEVLYQSYEARPAAGVRRILGVGDSFALSWGLSRSDGLFGQLERELGPQAEILNVSAPGLHTDEELARVRDALGRYVCPLTIVVWLLNDLPTGPRVHADADELGLRALFPDSDLRWWDRSRVVQTYKRWRWHRLRRAWYDEVYDPVKNRSGWAEYASILRQFRELEATRAAFVLYPLMEGHESGYPHQAYHDRVAAELREQQIPVLDLTPAFRGQTSHELWVHPQDQHPNARAHGIAAAAVGAWLRQEWPTVFTDQATRGE